MRPVGLLDIKQAVKDHRFRTLFPQYENDFVEYDKNPACACNVPLYKKLMSEKAALKQYWPNREVGEADINEYWTVINCSINELESRLRKLPKGRKQIAVARYEDQLTVIVHEMDIIG